MSISGEDRDENKAKEKLVKFLKEAVDQIKDDARLKEKELAYQIKHELVFPAKNRDEFFHRLTIN